MKYTFKQYRDIYDGVDIQLRNDNYLRYVFAHMKPTQYRNNLYLIPDNKWVFQKVGNKMYYSYVFIVQILRKNGMRDFQIPEYLNERLRTQGFRYKTLECKYLPEYNF